jgi:two-component system, cell cycle sensor histidine kinase and response regulator CckA
MGHEPNRLPLAQVRLGGNAAIEYGSKLETLVEVRDRPENALRMLIESLPMALVIADENGKITDLNESSLRMFGYSREDLLGQTVETLLPDRLRNSHRGHRAGYIKEPHTRPMGLGMELFARRKDGTEFPVEVSLGPLANKHGTLVSATIVDITERKKIEQQLRLAQRMEAIGQLAGGIAHDFNNLLAVIMGAADIIVDALPRGDPLGHKVEMIRSAGSSAADLIRQLLAFSRQQMVQPLVLDVRAVMERTRGMLQRIIGEDIEFELFVEDSVGSIKADPGQIEQVLLNLAANARDAMPKGGRITIRVSNVELDASDKKKHDPVVPGPYVMVSIEDTGCGMDLKTQARIFDPFFTTKELGKGTGLGLATVYGIVKQTGGYIWVYSEVVHGTIFRVYLPRVDKAVQTAEREPSEIEELHGSETILVAEDSESLREMAEEYLESIGYTVLSAVSGEKALQWAKDFQGPIHLLLTDVVMPEMSGPELANHMASLRPGVKIIFTSGYTVDAVARQGMLDPNVAFIQKPYRPKALAKKIRQVLNAGPGEIPAASARKEAVATSTPIKA